MKLNRLITLLLVATLFAIPSHGQPQTHSDIATSVGISVLLLKISFPYSLLFFAKINGSRVNLKDSCDFFSSYALMLHILNGTLRQKIVRFSLRMKTFLGKFAIFVLEFIHFKNIRL